MSFIDSLNHEFVVNEKYEKVLVNHMVVNNKHLPDTMLLLEQELSDEGWSNYQDVLLYIIKRDLKGNQCKLRHVVSATGSQREKAYMILNTFFPKDGTT